MSLLWKFARRPSHQEVQVNHNTPPPWEQLIVFQSIRLKGNGVTCTVGAVGWDNAC